MEADEIQRAASRSSVRFRVGPMFAMLGMAMVITALIIGIVVAVTAGDYFAYDKATRDAAGAGTGILDDLSFISTWTAWTALFVFLGIATMMVGIALIFSTIPSRIRQRASAMELVLPKVIEARQKPS